MVLDRASKPRKVDAVDLTDFYGAMTWPVLKALLESDLDVYALAKRAGVPVERVRRLAEEPHRVAIDDLGRYLAALDLGWAEFRAEPQEGFWERKFFGAKQ